MASFWQCKLTVALHSVAMIPKLNLISMQGSCTSFEGGTRQCAQSTSNVMSRCKNLHAISLWQCSLTVALHNVAIIQKLNLMFLQGCSTSVRVAKPS